MSFIGKLHEISLYGLISTIIGLIIHKATIDALFTSAFHYTGFSSVFYGYLFWSSVLFIPFAIIGGFATKYADNGEGLTFTSDKIVVIMFAHIGEDLLGIVLTPFWFLKDVFTKSMTGWKAFDYFLYLVNVLFIVAGFVFV